jgi:hypothetical protein
MSTISMRYDHPAYIARITAGGEAKAGTTFRWAAFTSTILKSVMIAGAIVQGTQATYIAYTISQAGTSTATLGTFTATTANMAQSHSFTGTSTLAAGDSVAVVAAGDGVGAAAVGLELEIQPGATVTV